MTGSALLFETDWRERAAPFIDGIKREARGSASRSVVVYTGQSSNKHHHHAVYIYIHLGVSRSLVLVFLFSLCGLFFAAVVSSPWVLWI